MSTESMAYDNATYVARSAQAMGEAGGAANTLYAKFVAFTALKAFSSTFGVTTAGTSTAHGFETVHVSGTTTTTLATSTLGTGTAGSVVNTALSTDAGGIDLAQGDILEVKSLTDVAGKAAVAFEIGVSPGASVTE